MASTPSLAAWLNSLTLSEGQLTPSFQWNGYNYAADVSGGVSAVTVTAVPTFGNSTIMINGVPASSGVPSAPVVLADGQNEIDIVVTGGWGWWRSTHTYTVVVTREGGNDNTTPMVSIVSPGQGQPFSVADTITLDATATDEEDGGLPVAWFVDGSPTGPSVAAVTLATGPHDVTAMATDSGGKSATDTVTILVTNQAPSIVSVDASPTSAPIGTPITLTGAASDPEFGDISAAIVWSSNLDGTIGTGASWSAVLSFGTHTITATVTDSHGASDSASLAAAVTNMPPAVTSATASASEVDFGTPVTFSGTATDDEDGPLSSQIQWTSNLSGPLGTGASVTATLSVGTHTVTASVSDSAGAGDTRTVDVVVNPVAGNPPTVNIYRPFENTYTDPGGYFLFWARASDAEDGNLGSSIVWSSNVSGQMFTGGFRYFVLPEGTHVVTASVTDSDGLTATDTVTVVVGDANTPPTVTITGAEPDAPYEPGTDVTFTATATDPDEDDGALTSQIAWTVNGVAQGGGGGSLTVALTQPGANTITASVTDSADATATDSIQVTVTGDTPTWPNILFVLTDDQGAETMDIYATLTGANGGVPTPNLNTLASAGVVMDNFWANPLCSPTRGTVLSGLYGHNSGVVNVGNTLPTSTTSIFELIRDESPANYDMATFGKWHLGGSGGIQHVINTGVPYYKGLLGGGIGDYFNWTYNSYDGTGTSQANTQVYSTRLLTQFAIDFIESHNATRPQDPWFIYLAYNAPHGTQALTGFQVPPRDLLDGLVGLPEFSQVIGWAEQWDNGQINEPHEEANNVRIYRAIIHAVDTELGRLLNAIGPVGSPQRDNTIIIFMGDNGTPSGVQDADNGVRGAKGDIWEGGIKVPLFISGTGVTRIGEREGRLAVSPDIFATIAELAGVPLDQGHVADGYSLVPFLTGANAANGRSFGFAELCGYGGSQYTVRNDRYKLLYDSGSVGNNWQMYDLVNDPLETDNLFNGGVPDQGALEDILSALDTAGNSGCFQ